MPVKRGRADSHVARQRAQPQFATVAMLKLPESRREKDMGTWAIYSIIDPEDETFAQGLQEDEWIIANVDWLTDMFCERGIALETASYRYFYQAVNPHDWRCTSCAGCM